jgi:hypothetical protein
MAGISCFRRLSFLRHLSLQVLASERCGEKSSPHNNTTQTIGNWNAGCEQFDIHNLALDWMAQSLALFFLSPSLGLDAASF